MAFSADSCPLECRGRHHKPRCSCSGSPDGEGVSCLHYLTTRTSPVYRGVRFVLPQLFARAVLSAQAPVVHRRIPRFYIPSSAARKGPSLSVRDGPTYPRYHPGSPRLRRRTLGATPPSGGEESLPSITAGFRPSLLGARPRRARTRTKNQLRLRRFWVLGSLPFGRRLGRDLRPALPRPLSPCRARWAARYDLLVSVTACMLSILGSGQQQCQGDGGNAR